jgi:CCR4-NOT transcription complex subunit 2
LQTLRYNRNWRFHKEIRLWLTKESGTAPSQKASTYERGIYTFFDPENWERVKKETVIMYDLLEEKAPLLGGGGQPQQQQAPQPLQSAPPGMSMMATNQGPQQQHVAQQHQLQQQQMVDQLRHRHGDMSGLNARFQGVNVGATGMGM